MAIINKTGITDGSTIQAEHVTRTIDALSGGSTDTVVATGSFTGSFTGDGSGLTGIVSSSYAVTASYADNALSAINTPNAVITASNTGNDDTIEFLKGGGGAFSVTVNNVVSSSYALTASYALNGGGGSDTNFANTSLTFDGNRAHDLNGFRVTFESASLNVFGISNTGVNVNAGQADRDFRVYTQGNTSTLFVEGSSDRVGVGKNTPNATLDVNGNAIITGSLSITGTSTFTTNNVNIGVGTVAILADADSAIDLSAAGANSGGGLVIPTGSITEAQEGSMYFDANTLRLYIYDGSEWRFVTLT